MGLCSIFAWFSDPDRPLRMFCLVLKPSTFRRLVLLIIHLRQIHATIKRACAVASSTCQAEQWLAVIHGSFSAAPYKPWILQSLESSMRDIEQVSSGFGPWLTEILRNTDGFHGSIVCHRHYHSLTCVNCKPCGKDATPPVSSSIITRWAQRV